MKKNVIFILIFLMSFFTVAGQELKQKLEDVNTKISDYELKIVHLKTKKNSYN